MLLLTEKNWLENLLEAGGITALIMFIIMIALVLCVFLMAQYLYEIKKKMNVIQDEVKMQNDRILELILLQKPPKY